jgi:uncharacterized glyoxalase superfamily protein PhnB
MAMTIDSVLQAQDIMPSLTVNDVQQSVRFYEGLGFAVEERWEDHGVLMGVMLIAGKCRIGLSQDDWKKGRDRVKGQGVRLYLTTSQNVDEVAARAKAAGITLETEPHDTEWKSRAFEVTDPTGFRLTISSEVTAK